MDLSDDLSDARSVVFGSVTVGVYNDRTSFFFLDFGYTCLIWFLVCSCIVGGFVRDLCTFMFTV
jgi:hypothetical protein